jgi:hypothetical protein
MLQYNYLKQRGALRDAGEAAAPRLPTELRHVPRQLLELVPQAVARENLILPLSQHGETLVCAAANPGDLLLRDKLSFILNRKVQLVPTNCASLLAAIDHYYGQVEHECAESLLSEFTDTSIDLESLPAPPPPVAAAPARKSLGRHLNRSLLEFKKGAKVLEESLGDDTYEGTGMFFHVVEEGKQVLMRRPDGTMEVIRGPRRVWAWGRKFTPLSHHVAHPGEFLLVRFRDGRQEHLPGPAEFWLDPRVHQSVAVQEALQLAAKEAVVVYSRRADGDGVARRIVYGPGLFIRSRASGCTPSAGTPARAATPEWRRSPTAWSSKSSGSCPTRCTTTCTMSVPPTTPC